MPSPTHVTLTANAVREETTATAHNRVSVFAWDPSVTQEVWATLDGTDPVIGSNGYVIPAGSRRTLGGDQTINAARFLCAGAAKLEVEWS